MLLATVLVAQAERGDDADEVVAVVALADAPKRQSLRIIHKRGESVSRRRH
jgi:hypothetical protein